jgi:hypothetical protein
MSGSRVISAVAVIIAVALAGATWAFGYLAAVSAKSSTCAGRTLVAGYRIGAVELFVFPLFSSICVIVFAAGFKREPGWVQ